jgi:hypothetical protein
MTWKRPVIGGGGGSCMIDIDGGRGRGGIKSATGILVACDLRVPVEKDSVRIHMEEGLCGCSWCRFSTNVRDMADHILQFCYGTNYRLHKATNKHG